MLRRPASTAITTAALRLGVQRMPTELRDFFATEPVDPLAAAVLPPFERRGDCNLMRPMNSEPSFARVNHRFCREAQVRPNFYGRLIWRNFGFCTVWYIRGITLRERGLRAYHSMFSERLGMVTARNCTRPRFPTFERRTSSEAYGDVHFKRRGREPYIACACT